MTSDISPEHGQNYLWIISMNDGHAEVISRDYEWAFNRPIYKIR